MTARILILPLFLLTSCGKQESPELSAKKLPAANVQVASVAKRTLQLSEDITGTVRAKMRAVIEAKISGRILTLNASLGQGVKEGEVLATLDAQEMTARVQSAQAMLDQATRDEQRASGLVSTNAISKSDYETTKARLEVAKASLSEAQTMMGYAKVTAPFAGVITRKLTEQGDFASPGKPLLELENPTQLRIEADIPEALIANLKLGDALEVRSVQASSTTAKIAEISPTGDPNSRTFPVKLDLPTDSTLHPGQFVRLAVPVRQYEALVIPKSSLVQRGQLQMVFVNETNTAKLRLVRAGRERPEGIEVLSGLDGGESLVTTGIASLQDGQPLTITP
jgi:RND family efflux transporter MFP subunit